MIKKILLIMLMTIFLSSVASATINDSIFWISFDDDFEDVSGNSDLNLTGSPSRILNGILNNGSTYTEGTWVNAPDRNDASFSVSYWINVSSSFLQRPITHATADAVPGIRFQHYISPTGAIVYTLYTSSVVLATCPSAGEDLRGDGYTHIVLTFNDTAKRCRLYINSVLETSATGSGTLYNPSATMQIGDVSYETARYVRDDLDEMAYYSRTLLASEISVLYNNGTGINPYDVPPAVALFEITAKSFWDGSTINVFNATVNGTTYNTTNGTITTNFNQSSSYVFNITIFSADWFNTTVEHNISSNLDQSLKQTEANISFKFSSGDLINFTSINLTALDINESFNITNGYKVLYPNAGFINFSVISLINLFPSFNFTLNLTALDNSSFDFVVNETQNIITFLDENSSNPIDNANITVTFPSGITLNTSTNSTGQINFSYIQNSSLEFGDYSYYFDKIGYVNITLSDVINESNIPHTRTYNLSRAKLNIFIYDRVTRELLNGTAVNIAFIGLFNETTSTGTLIKDNLTIVAGDYLIYASAEGYKTSIRSLTFTNQEEFTLNFYLLNLTDPNAGTLFVSTKDSFFRDITGAKVDLLEYVPASLSYVSVDSCVSNVNAQCSFGVELNTKVYYIRATSIIDGVVFVAETSQNGEIFTVDNDIRNLIFFTRSTFSISTSTNLIYRPTETFVNNISSISVDFFTSDGTAKEVCVEYFIKNGSDWTSVTGDTYCLFSSNALQNIDVDVTLNRSNTYQARIYVKESFDNILKTYDYPDVSSTGSVFNNDFKAIIVMILWICALAFSMHQKNITLFFFLACILSWAEITLFPIFSIVIISVFKTIVGLLSMYIARKKEDFQ